MLKQTVCLVVFLLLVMPFPAALCAEVSREAFIGSGGELELVFYIKGKKIARQVWDARGDHLSTTGIIPNGTVKHRLADGTVWEIPYKNNRAHGVSKIYDRRGTLKVTSNYNNGRLDGISRVYSAPGTLTGELSYEQGILLGQK